MFSRKVLLSVQGVEFAVMSPVSYSGRNRTAQQVKCTYEAVRQQTSRYSKELAGHSHLDGKTRYYDDWAVEFLRERRKKNPIIIEQSDTKQLIEELQQKNTVLFRELLKMKKCYQTTRNNGSTTKRNCRDGGSARSRTKQETIFCRTLQK